MTLFEAVKENVTARDAAIFYGMKVRSNGMMCCPFHHDHNPSTKVDRRYHCFACHADGDVIDFVSNYFHLSLKEAAEKLANDFSVSYEMRKPNHKTKSQSKANERKGKTLEQFFQEQEEYVFRVYSDYYHMLGDWKVRFAPKISDDDWHPLFIEAAKNYERIAYKMDVLLTGALEERVTLVLESQKEVKVIEQRIKKERA